MSTMLVVGGLFGIAILVAVIAAITTAVSTAAFVQKQEEEE